MSVQLRYKTNIVIIGAGQAGLSSAYHLLRLGMKIGKDFVILDASPHAGGAWQDRWDSLTLSTVNKIHDLPGLSFEDSLPEHMKEVKANEAVPHYYEIYEKNFGIQVLRPAKVYDVQKIRERFHIDTDSYSFSARGIINATGTWNNPYIPQYPGAELFQGEQLHTRDFKTADYFKGKHVIIVGAGISALQLLDQISKVTSTTWVTRKVPQFHEGPFDEAAGSHAVALVEDRVRRGLPPLSVVSVTGLPLTAEVRDMQSRSVLKRLPMFAELTETGVKWEDGTSMQADVILWNTGFRGDLNHLQHVVPKEPEGGILIDGRLATRVAKEPRIHLVGYGPSASTIGANRAGNSAARELIETIGWKKDS